MYNFYVVYFINCMININYLEWLHQQLSIIINQTEKNKIHYLNQTHFHIICTIENGNQNYFLNKLKTFFPNIKFIVEFYFENEYEYRGIMKVWELGQIHNNKNDIILYYHSKGVTRGDHYNMFANDNYNSILKNLTKVFEVFNSYPYIDKVGESCGGEWLDMV